MDIKYSINLNLIVKSDNIWELMRTETLPRIKASFMDALMDGLVEKIPADNSVILELVDPKGEANTVSSIDYVQKQEQEQEK